MLYDSDLGFSFSLRAFCVCASCLMIGSCLPVNKIVLFLSYQRVWGFRLFWVLHDRTVPAWNQIVPRVPVVGFNPTIGILIGSHPSQVHRPAFMK